MLFSHDCANLFRNEREGNIYKLNFYNGLADLLQLNFSQYPMRKLNAFTSIMNAFTILDYRKNCTFIKNAENSVKLKVEELLFNLTRLLVTV